MHFFSDPGVSPKTRALWPQSRPAHWSAAATPSGRGAWLLHRAQTLALWIMLAMTVPQIADELAPIPTTHNPTAFFVVSLLALASNAALAAYQSYRIRKLKLSPLKDQIYAGTKAYQRIVEEDEWGGRRPPCRGAHTRHRSMASFPQSRSSH